MPVLDELRMELLLRRWRPADREPFAALHADPLVMKHFPGTQSRQESDALVERAEATFEQNGFGPWAVEVPNVAPFIGFVGLSIPRFEAHFTPCGKSACVTMWRMTSITHRFRMAIPSSGMCRTASLE